MKCKHLPRLISCALLLCLLLSGCADGTVEETAAPTGSSDAVWAYDEVDSALEKLNFDLDYTTVYYGLNDGLDDDSSSAEVRNLSGTKVDNYRIQDGVIGCRILASTEDLAAFEQTIEEVTAASLEQDRQSGLPIDEEDYTLIGMTRKTADVEYNEAFFRNNALLLIDLCARGANVVRFFPENLAVNGDSVSIHVRWDRDNAWVAGCSGQFCLIVIPSGCTTVEMDIN